MIYQSYQMEKYIFQKKFLKNYNRMLKKQILKIMNLVVIYLEKKLKIIQFYLMISIKLSLKFLLQNLILQKKWKKK